MSAANTLESAAVANLQALARGAYLGDPRHGVVDVFCRFTAF